MPCKNRLPVLHDSPPPALPTIIHLGRGVYQPPGAAFPVRVSPSEDFVLGAFLRQPAMTLPELADLSGVAEASIGKVVARLVTSYDGAFAAAIRRPGRRGRGGYAIRIVDQQLSSNRPATPAAPISQ